MREPCGKITYQSKGEAEIAAAVIYQRMSKRHKAKGRLNTYTCRQCGKFHLTSKARRK